MVTRTSRKQRTDYVTSNVDTYTHFLTQVQDGPFSARDKMEFAAISANTQMGGAIKGFLASRGLNTKDAIGEALHASGVNGPYVKAGYCVSIKGLDDSMIPNPNIDMIAQRQEVVKDISGLGWAKYSFAASLIAPFESSIICLDTHMFQTYTGLVPTNKDLYGRTKKAHSLYERLESLLIGEARSIGVAPFLFQWAVWDMQRAFKSNTPIETHDFLWS